MCVSEYYQGVLHQISPKLKGKGYYYTIILQFNDRPLHFWSCHCHVFMAIVRISGLVTVMYLVAAHLVY